MPSCSLVVQPEVRSQTASRHRPRKRPRPRDPSLGNTATAESDMKFWAGWFARFHCEEPSHYVVYALRTVDCPVRVSAASTEPASPPQFLRCVREVAKFDGAKGVRWLLITWVCGLPGVQFQRCASLEEATARLDETPSTVTFEPFPPRAA